jgi:hypothetical protein
MYFAATEQEMLRAGETVKNGAQLTGGDYLATLGVYHELHCLVSSPFYILDPRQLGRTQIRLAPNAIIPLSREILPQYYRKARELSVRTPR